MAQKVNLSHDVWRQAGGHGHSARRGVGGSSRHVGCRMVGLLPHLISAAAAQHDRLDFEQTQRSQRGRAATTSSQRWRHPCRLGLLLLMAAVCVQADTEACERRIGAREPWSGGPRDGAYC